MSDAHCTFHKAPLLGYSRDSALYSLRTFHIRPIHNERCARTSSLNKNTSSSIGAPSFPPVAIFVESPITIDGHKSDPKTRHKAPTSRRTPPTSCAPKACRRGEMERSIMKSPYQFFIHIMKFFRSFLLQKMPCLLSTSAFKLRPIKTTT